MDAQRPHKTPADYLVIGVSPALIMLLVGSLSFFLILVFYRGEAAGSVRWVMFWFVFAVVLVSRLGIEQGAGYSAGYGLALAAATWLYLAHLHPAWLLGVVLLGTVWWCANKLTRDCTLIDDDEDSSGHGLLEGGQKDEGRRQKRTPDSLDKADRAAVKKAGVPDETRAPRAAPHAPGKWVVWFSLAALPLFGLGQMLLPAGDTDSRQRGFTLLFVYLASAVGLLLTTSFLGLRRYLRQRHLQMPGTIAFAWIRWGLVVAIVVLAAALLLPRPGAGEAWMNLRYRIDYQLRRASEFALRFGPHGSGEGRTGNEVKPGDRDEHGVANDQGRSDEQSGNDPQARQRQPGGKDHSRDASSPEPSPSAGHDPAFGWYRVLRFLFLLFAAALLCWWLVRFRHLIARLARSFLEALAQFFRKLFGYRLAFRRGDGESAGSQARPRPFAAYENPFLTGSDASWTREQLILYSYEAIQAWAEERGARRQPQQTAREFCLALSERFPEIEFELSRLSFLQSHAAYGLKAPDPCDLEPVRQLWQFVSGPQAVQTA